VYLLSSFSAIGFFLGIELDSFLDHLRKLSNNFKNNTVLKIISNFYMVRDVHNWNYHVLQKKMVALMPSHLGR
jgi:hypothetical protein